MTHETTETEKQEALRNAVVDLGKHLGIDPQALWVLAEPQEHEHYGLAVYEIEGQEYALGTDQEADAAARDLCDGEEIELPNNFFAYKL
jgi:hypothetical protein